MRQRLNCYQKDIKRRGAESESEHSKVKACMNDSTGTLWAHMHIFGCVEDDAGKVTWDVTVCTDQSPGRKPDLLMWDKRKKILYIFEVAVSQSLTERATQKRTHYMLQGRFGTTASRSVGLLPISLL